MDILAALRQEEAKFEKHWREETSDVCRCESEDFEGNKRAVGKV